MGKIYSQLNENEEIWRKCQRFPLYSVSNLGNVRNDKRMCCLTKRLSNSRGGYVVGVCDADSKGHTVTVARLVAEAFLERPVNAVEVVHIGSKLDDSVENLRWRPLVSQEAIDGEVWKPISGFENRYEVSSMGRVRSLSFNQTGRTLILKAGSNECGYLSVGLYDGDGRRQQRMYVHRLVAQAFIPNPDDLPHVNHRNEDPSDNRVENLEWLSAEDNNKYGGRLFRAAHGKGNRLNQRTIDGRYIRTFDSAAEVERVLGFCRQVIARAAANGKPAYGYFWEQDCEERGAIKMPIIRI